MLNKTLARRINLITIIAVYFLILVGGIVRNMESGMGCPDWPKCFGYYIPPTSDVNLPDNYENLYLEKRLKKNQKLANILNSLGFLALSEKILQDNNIQVTEKFSVRTAWIEYINRLIGVVIGLLIVINFILSYAHNRTSVRALAFVSLVLVLFQGWVGSLVVSTNLLPGFISFHMTLALLLVVLLIVQYVRSGTSVNSLENYRVPIMVLLVMFILQVYLGLNVREQVDTLKFMGIDKSIWIENLNTIFYIHRSFSLAIMGIVAWLCYLAFKKGIFYYAFLSLAVVILFEVFLGALMAYFELPFLTQPFHLLFGSIAFGIIVYLQTISLTRINYIK